MRDDVDHRRVYAKGFFDGIRAGGKMLTEQKYAEKVESLSGVELKVLESVPKEEAWTAQKIAAEIYRKTRSSVENGMVGRSLNRLLSIGLITEQRRGEFCKSPVKQAMNVSVVSKSVPSVTETTRDQTTDAAPDDALGALAGRIRQSAALLVGIADEIDRCALGLQEGSERNAVEAEKLRKLRELLGSI